MDLKREVRQFILTESKLLLIIKKLIACHGLNIPLLIINPFNMYGNINKIKMEKIINKNPNNLFVIDLKTA